MSGKPLVTRAPSRESDRYFRDDEVADAHNTCPDMIIKHLPTLQMQVTSYLERKRRRKCNAVFGRKKQQPWRYVRELFVGSGAQTLDQIRATLKPML